VTWGAVYGYVGGKVRFNLKESPAYGFRSTQCIRESSTESGGPDIVAAHSRRFASVLGNAEMPGALAVWSISANG